MATRKKRMASLALATCLALLGLMFGLAFPSGALAWDDCPKGLVNDPYPGACSRYEDTNDDGICDLSQPKPSDPSTTTTSVATTTTTSGDPPTGDCPLGPCVGCGACLSISSIVAAASTGAGDTTVTAAAVGTVAIAAAGTSATTSTTTSPTSTAADSSGAMTAAAATETSSGGSSLLTHYMVSPIAIGFFLIYAVSFFLYKTKRIRTATHRKIWNVLLLATFLITGVFGLVLTIQLDYELPFTMPINLLFWHVEAGITMTLISLFHVGWHFNYYRCMLRNSRKKVRTARAAGCAQTVGEGQLVSEARKQRRAERQARRVQHSPPRRQLEPEPD